MLILNALAPLSRRDEWWSTDGPLAVIECELRRQDREFGQYNRGSNVYSASANTELRVLLHGGGASKP
jgi:hypothetical protein